MLLTDLALTGEKTEAQEPYVKTAQELIPHLVELVQGARERVWIKAMHIAFEDEAVRPLYKALMDKRREHPNVDIRIWVGAKTFDNSHKSTSRAIVTGKTLPFMRKENLELFQNLHDSQIEINITGYENFLTGLPLLNNFGNDHFKGAIIDNKMALGGINFDDHILRTGYDMWLFSEDQALLKEMEVLMQLGNNGGDFEMQLNTQTSLVVDAPIPFRRKSLCLTKAWELCNHSDVEEIIFLGQYGPDGKLKEILKRRSEDGVKVSTMMARPETFNKLIYATLSLIKKHTSNKDLANSGVEINYDPEGFLHLKTLLVKRRSPDGSSNWYMYFGSHNLVVPGVFLGTREGMILTSDSNFVLPVMNAIRERYPALISSD
jgi:phosphatidylserine/phosphatidylglycerophosphate/cardiolipin synthase-like enzyme